MATTGYSGTPLIKKLGIRENMKVTLVNAPANYFNLLEKDISGQFCKNRDLPDFLHVFTISKQKFEQDMQALQPLWEKNTAISIWVSWYKKSLGMATNITEDTIRDYALTHGLVDIKVCAVSELWSGLKLVVPLAKRKAK